MKTEPQTDRVSLKLDLERALRDLNDARRCINDAGQQIESLELENLSLQRRLGEAKGREVALREAVRSASNQLQTAARRIADSGNDSLGELVLGWALATRATLNQGDKGL